MTESISLKNLPNELKIQLLRELGYDSDGKIVLKNGEVFLDRYLDKPIQVNNMLILQGSTIIINDNPLSISSYLEDYPNGL